ncbi:hypothetical protein HA48_20355 [Pantoea wallisii]|uniref:Uncharacterized protein n=1 Tax=Pantoea wallisii TaxID=1076551 RepID=A0A1X1CVR5_9GAMM|nr:hypothetical protein HA48_20355 [Pantoea wallisii]
MSISFNIVTGDSKEKVKVIASGTAVDLLPKEEFSTWGADTFNLNKSIEKSEAAFPMMSFSVIRRHGIIFMIPMAGDLLSDILKWWPVKLSRLLLSQRLWQHGNCSTNQKIPQRFRRVSLRLLQTVSRIKK